MQIRRFYVQILKIYFSDVFYFGGTLCGVGVPDSVALAGNSCGGGLETLEIEELAGGRVLIQDRLEDAEGGLFCLRMLHLILVVYSTVW